MSFKAGNASQEPVGLGWGWTLSAKETGSLKSEKIVIAAPMSFAGSAGRLWKLQRVRHEIWARTLLAIIAIMLITIAWTVVLGWYLLFGVLLVPYRIVRRGQRQRKRQALQHREMLAVIDRRNPR